MKKTLIISGHPALQTSLANSTILAALSSTEGVDVVNIGSTYTDGNIDVNLEQMRLVEADLIILQFPFIWYGMPSILKNWVEKVLSYGFAFGPGGDKLKGKKIMLSVTLGGNSQAYSSVGQHRFPVETFLLPLELLINYCGMKYIKPFYSYEMSTRPGHNENEIREKALLHAQELIDIIRDHKFPAHQPAVSRHHATINDYKNLQTNKK